MAQERNKIHLTNFNIAGFSYWDGPEAWENLKIGTQLQLVRETDNGFDPYAVAIYFNELKLGYIPRRVNHDISKFLDMGWDSSFEVRIQRIDPTENPEDQVEVIIYVKQAHSIFND